MTITVSVNLGRVHFYIIVINTYTYTHTYTQVDNQWTNKDHEGARHHSIRAQRWSVVALVLGVLGFPLICISIAVPVIAIVDSTRKY